MTSNEQTNQQMYPWTDRQITVWENKEMKSVQGGKWNNDWTNQLHVADKQRNGAMNKWAKEWLDKQMNYTNEWTNKWMSLDRMDKGMNEHLKEWTYNDLTKLKYFIL